MRRTSMILTAMLTVLQFCYGLTAQPMAETEGEAKWQSRFPIHPELYVPEPIQDRQERIGLMLSPEVNPLISYDARTGQEVVLNVTRDANAPLERWIDGGSGADPAALDEERLLRDFSDLQRLTDPSLYPWRVNCKLFYTKAGLPRVASGLLIDPLHVLTAGHCVHEGKGGNWVTDMVVVPAYDNGARPYGDAVGVTLYAWAGWRWFGNYEDDIGIIKLDRPIGALTGWNGFGYTDDPSFYRNGTFHSAGYPAEFPFDGKSMYYWYGTFDVVDYDESLGAWSSNELGISRRAYGGQSGSAAYYVQGESRHAYAVLSNQYQGVTYLPRITASKFGDMQEFISRNTPSSFDLVPLNVKVSPQTFMPGDRLSSMSYVVHNYSSVSWNGAVNVSVYLSPDDNISASDTLIDSHGFAWNFGPKSSVSVGVTTPPAIPIDAPMGHYWIGVILDIADQEVGNNDSDGQMAAPVVVGENVLF